MPAAAIYAAIAGATILVPPTIIDAPFIIYDTPVLGSAFKDISGEERYVFCKLV